jgi:pimeloyl-ACP methyl ester carboxylesterase
MKPVVRTLLLLALAPPLALGCSNGGTATVQQAAGSADSGAARLAFSTCSLLTDPRHPPLGPGLGGIESAMAECATTTAPAVWDDPSGDRIDLFVKRYPAREQPAKGQLWLLAGGPGYAGSDSESWAYRLAPKLPTLDIYMPDHRGTGKSGLATCPSRHDPTCAAAVPHLDGLTTTGAARDLALLIDGTRGPAQQVAVYGRGYGTYWAQRYLEIRPEQPTAVILDSAFPASGLDWDQFNDSFDATAHAVLERCKADATCSAKLGGDPFARADSAFAAFAANPDACVAAPGGHGTTISLHYDLAMIAGGGGYFDWMLLPAAIYRAGRCNRADSAWFGDVLVYLTSFPTSGVNEGPPPASFSGATSTNIITSEFWPNSPVAWDVFAKDQTRIAYNDAEWAFPGTTAGGEFIPPLWPTPPHDRYYGTWPSVSTPVLVLQGGLDPWAPFGDVLKRHYAGTNQHFVEFPNANHGVVKASPMVDPRADSCGQQVMVSFLAEPHKAPDTSCIAGMAPLDYAHPPQQWLDDVGIQDLWENP